MGRVAFIWDLEDDPEGNYWHICVEGHGVTREEVEEVLAGNYETATREPEQRPARGVWLDGQRQVPHGHFRVRVRRPVDRLPHYGLRSLAARSRKAEEETMSNNKNKGDKVRPKVQWTAEDRARHQAIRDMFRNWHPSPEELIASRRGGELRPPRRVSRAAPVRGGDQAGPRGGGTHPGRGVPALWDRPAGPFSPGKRAQQEPDAGHALALRCRSRETPGPDHRSDPRHAAGEGQGEAAARGTREVGRVRKAPWQIAVVAARPNQGQLAPNSPRPLAAAAGCLQTANAAESGKAKTSGSMNMARDRGDCKGIGPGTSRLRWCCNLWQRF